MAAEQDQGNWVSEDSQERGGSDDLAAAFDAEFGDDLAEANQHPPAVDEERKPEEEEEGVDDEPPRPAKRQRVLVPEHMQAATCSHPSSWAGLCVVCGAPTAHVAPTAIRHLHARAALEVDASEAERVRSAEAARLRAARKLLLVLDLDHTLVHSVRPTELAAAGQMEAARVARAEEAATVAEHPNDATLHHLGPPINLWTKLRPGAAAFLAAAAATGYELHIYTMGDRAYAAAMRRLLEAHAGVRFASAISGSDTTVAGSKDLDVALADESLAVILDDTADVWGAKARADNLVRVERYIYFGAAGLLARRRDERAQDGMLAVAGRVLTDVHAAVYGQAGTDAVAAVGDARAALAAVRARVLDGCVLLFSRCWPSTVSGPDQPLWRLAVSLGARCVDAPTYDPADGITHMVAGAGAGGPGPLGRQGAGAQDRPTAKVAAAHAAGVPVVSPDWIVACSFRWARLDVEDWDVRGKLGIKANGTTAVGQNGRGAAAGAEG